MYDILLLVGCVSMTSSANRELLLGSSCVVFYYDITASGENEIIFPMAVIIVLKLLSDLAITSLIVLYSILKAC